MGFFALDLELGVSLNWVGFASFDLSTVGELVFGGVGYFNGFGDDLTELAGEDDGLPFLEVGGQDHEEIFQDQQHLFIVGSQ